MITESDPVVHTRQACYTKLPLQIAPVTSVCVFCYFFAPLMEFSNILFWLVVSLSCLFRATTLTLTSPFKNKIFHFRAIKLTKTTHCHSPPLSLLQLLANMCASVWHLGKLGPLLRMFYTGRLPSVSQSSVVLSVTLQTFCSIWFLLFPESKMDPFWPLVQNNGLDKIKWT